MSSPVDTRPPKTKPIYYSSRGGSRTKGSDGLARANASPPPSTALETPLPRSVHSHYARGGENEWNYSVEDGDFDEAMLHDHLRLQQLGWVNQGHPPRSLRGGPAIPGQTSKPKKQLRLRSLFRKSKAGSGSGSLSSPTSTGSSDPYQHSEIWSEETQSVALSDFTSPSFLPDEIDSYDGYEPGEPDTATIEEARTRSFSLTSVGSGDMSLTPEAQIVAREYSPPSTGTLAFKQAVPTPTPPDKS
ncbi:hypothetical protein FRC14_003869 [Serendipita sp. 396]|nr:hypothetical protein FRC14_003869 [Serendipita sp. 396]KAG8789474.1 hypothetical protein FRC15_008331 [Serendipita sp. 397]KAG8804706.1 hypothetical protein FRC16_003596 [Serendipita sp. 398]KAG8879060.1 hypothetical protein FRC20_003819 [Serendipita sp. 405]